MPKVSTHFSQNSYHWANSKLCCQVDSSGTQILYPTHFKIRHFWNYGILNFAFPPFSRCNGFRDCVVKTTQVVHQSRCASNFRGQWYVGGPNMKTVWMVTPALKRVSVHQLHRTSHALLLRHLCARHKIQKLNSMSNHLTMNHPLVICLIVFKNNSLS